MKNGRCRLHGGLTPSGPALPQFTDGKRSKYLYLPAVLTARVEEMTLDLVGNLEESIKIQRAIETQLYERLDTGESPDGWATLKETLDAMDRLEGGITTGAGLYRIREIVTGALGELSLHTQIQGFHESQRKLSESVSKIRKEIQETYTQEQWNVMLNVVLNTTRKHVDAAVLGYIANDLDEYRRSESDSQSPRLLGPGV